ncbi:thioredoxin [Clostridium butyricum]|jgi:thioredoxin 1|uniref:Thioredoxin n=1 Tax=Clostridium butyricum TaxID=1492 RepID=A0A2S7F9Q7_CLOBU|nr:MULTISPECIES: thioredoxin [Clostridium]ETI87458.1 MAG: Thioredoxin [Clostridium butyricum DORA_1]APF24519.1 thioredoxin [Clostridium butyricum]EMU53838.1 thioredoxin [Clostridium butyricum DKU-01]ENZ33700.1 thioredoxin [Clostridium butyricum 60E.3]KHD15893.1 thioredoxin [Clostridium butyricum]
MKIVNSNEFKNEISEGVVLVDFFATWCGPCKMLGPVLEDLGKELEGKAKIIKVDIDQSGDLADEFRISSVPTMILFKDNKIVDTMVGFLPKERIKQVIESNL